MKLSDLLQQFYAYLMTHGLRDVFAAAMIGLLGYWLARAVPRLLGRVLTRARLDPTLTTFVTHLSHYALLGFVIIVVLGRLGIETASLVAVLGAAGLAIGLALQGSLSNFAAGVLIIIFRPFRVGDTIEAGGTVGTVHEIQIFTTVLHTADNLRVLVPNDLITKGRITNYSANATRRLDLTVKVAPVDDLQQVQQMLAQVLQEDPRVLTTPPPLVAIAEFSSSSVQFVIQPWVSTGEYQAARYSLPGKIKRALDLHGVTTL